MMNNITRNLATQIRVDRIVGDTHGASAEFYWHATIISDQLILVEAIRFGGEIDIFVTKSSMQQTTDTKRFCVSGGAQSRSTLRADHWRRPALRLFYSFHSCAYSMRARRLH